MNEWPAPHDRPCPEGCIKEDHHWPDVTALAEAWARRRRLLASCDTELAVEAFKAGYAAHGAGPERVHQGRMGTVNDPRTQIPGWEGSIGPGPAQYHLPHVYARDVHSGAGNCVCGAHLGDSRHVQAAPGVPVPDGMRT